MERMTQSTENIN